MTTSTDVQYFQDYMPGNVCFGCGSENEQGLQIRSFWKGDIALCRWMPEEKYHGWSDLLNGGIIATLIDCHCMGTAVADSYQREQRPMGSFPEYRYATGSLNIKYLKPTSTQHEVELRAIVLEVKGRKTTLTCEMHSQGQKTAEAEVIAIRVYDASDHSSNNPFKS